MDQNRTALNLSPRNQNDSFIANQASQRSTPLSMISLSELKFQLSKSASKSKQQAPSVTQMYQNVRSKLAELQDAFKEDRNHKELEMLATYVKVLQKIGADVIEAKQKYQNLNKEELKNNKRMEIVEQLNHYRKKCHMEKLELKNLQEKTRKVQQQNLFMENELAALQILEFKKEAHQKSEKLQFNQKRNNLLYFGKPLADSRSVKREMCGKSRSKTIEMIKGERNWTQDAQKLPENGNPKGASQESKQSQNPESKHKFSKSQRQQSLGHRANKTEVLKKERRKNNFFDFQFANTITKQHEEVLIEFDRKVQAQKIDEFVSQSK